MVILEHLDTVVGQVLVDILECQATVATLVILDGVDGQVSVVILEHRVTQDGLVFLGIPVGLV